MQVVIIIS